MGYSQVVGSNSWFESHISRGGKSPAASLLISNLAKKVHQTQMETHWTHNIFTQIYLYVTANKLQGMKGGGGCNIYSIYNQGQIELALPL